MRLTDFKALTFDCYGTLIDWETGMTAGPGELGRQSQAHAHARPGIGSTCPARIRPAASNTNQTLFGIVGHRLQAPGRGVERRGDSRRMRSLRAVVAHWPAFADTAGALQYLKKFYKLIILSNVDNRSFGFSNRRLGVEFDAIYTAEDIGSYKPDDRNFTYMLDHIGDLGLAKRDILHTAESLFHDHVPATKHDIASCWIYRRHAQQGFGATMNPGTVPKTNFKFHSLAELVKNHQAVLENC